MINHEIMEKLKNVTTILELDALRLETVQYMMDGGDKDKFYRIQKAFIKAKTNLKGYH